MIKELPLSGALTVAQTAALAGVTVSSVYQAINRKSNPLPAVLILGKTCILADDANTYKDSCRKMWRSRNAIFRTNCGKCGKRIPFMSVCGCG